MRNETSVSGETRPEGLPLVIEHQRNSLAVAARIVATIVLLIVTLSPPVAVVALALESATWPAVAERPLAVLQIASGLLLWAMLFVWPAQRMLSSLTSTRRTTIAGGSVHFVEHSLFGRRSWSAPLASYDGLAHHVRSSLMGTRHELILSHPDQSRSVIVHIADRIAQPEIERMAVLLGVREVPARTLYPTGAISPVLAIAGFGRLAGA